MCNVPSAADHDEASKLYRAVLEAHESSGNISFRPHPRKIFLHFKGTFTEKEKTEIKKDILSLRASLSINKKIVFEFENVLPQNGTN